jgi:hypothetical protein
MRDKYMRIYYEGGNHMANDQGTISFMLDVVVESWVSSIDLRCDCDAIEVVGVDETVDDSGPPENGFSVTYELGLFSLSLRSC